MAEEIGQIKELLEALLKSSQRMEKSVESLLVEMRLALSFSSRQYKKVWKTIGTDEDLERLKRREEQEGWSYVSHSQDGALFQRLTTNQPHAN